MINKSAYKIEYETIQMSVKEYMAFAKLTSEEAVYSRIEKVKSGLISRDILDFEQLATGYPYVLYVRVRKK